jgi:hypothetical protein
MYALTTPLVNPFKDPVTLLQIVLAYNNVPCIRWYTLTYADIRLGYVRHIGFIRLKHGRMPIRRGPARHYFLNIPTYGLCSRHTLNTLEVPQMYGTLTLAFQRIFVILLRMKII